MTSPGLGGTSETITLGDTGSLRTLFSDDGAATDPTVTNELTVGTGVNIRGRVILQNRTDPEGMGLGHVTIVPGGKTSQLNADGTWMIPSISAGTYSLFANAAGYLATQIDGVVGSSADVLLADTTLRLGDANGDGAVSIQDISGVASNFGLSEPRPWVVGGPAPDTGIPIPATATPTQTGGGGAPAAETVEVVRAMSFIDRIKGAGYIDGGGSTQSRMGGIQEFLFVMGDDGDPMTGQLAESWSVDPAGTKLTLTIRSGISWNPPRGEESLTDEFGDLVADDITRWMNQSNVTTNPDSAHGDRGDFAAEFLDATTLNSTTLEIELVSPLYYGMPLSQFGILGAASAPDFIRAQDFMGFSWANSHAVGTEPFVQSACIPNDRCSIHALDTHWRIVPEIDIFTVRQIPDEETRKALLRTGEVDVIDVEFTEFAGLVGEGFILLDTQPGNKIGQSILWSGNLWEEFHAVAGDPLLPWNAPAYDSDRP